MGRVGIYFCARHRSNFWLGIGARSRQSTRAISLLPESEPEMVGRNYLELTRTHNLSGPASGLLISAFSLPCGCLLKRAGWSI